MVRRSASQPFLLGSLLLGALGCNNAVPVDDTDGGGGSGTDGSGSTTSEDSTADGSTGGDLPGQEGILVSANRDLDILFVIDNSGSMGLAQANLSESLGSFVSVLEAEDVSANYRVGITTTDDSNYWCNGPGVSTPESGQFVLSSCRSRLNDFFFSGTDTDASTACTDYCGLEAIEILPTTTHLDPNPRVRPWLENIEGVTNLPEGVSATEALQCFMPQGINGCGFESHLESMWKALRLTQNTNQDEFGFLRDQAALAIVFVSDEADCSFNRDHQNIVFGEEGVGNQVFWSLPDLQQTPTSAVCWNAGVSCDFSLDSEQCTAIDLDVDGNETMDEDAAALYPLSKYTAFVEEIEAEKKTLNPGQEVLVSAIVGVPENYPSIQQLSYAEGPDAGNPASFQASFGIGPGCSSQIAEAVPPVRLKEFAEAFLVDDGDANLFSVCSTDYSPALGAIASAVRSQLRPACMPQCVADTDPVLEGLQPLCMLTQTYSDGTGIVEENIPECAAGNTIPGDGDVCFVALVEGDMDQACIDEGWNLQFGIVRRDGIPAPSGAQISATCSPSTNQAVDCPGLPG